MQVASLSLDLSRSLVAAGNHIRGSALFQTAECIHLHNNKVVITTRCTWCMLAAQGTPAPHASTRAWAQKKKKKERRNENALRNELKVDGSRGDVVQIFLYMAYSVCVCWTNRNGVNKTNKAGFSKNEWFMSLFNSLKVKHSWSKGLRCHVFDTQLSLLCLVVLPVSPEGQTFLPLIQCLLFNFTFFFLYI